MRLEASSERRESIHCSSYMGLHYTPKHGIHLQEFLGNSSYSAGLRNSRFPAT